VAPLLDTPGGCDAPAAFHEAASRGLNMADVFPKLVAARGFGDAEDVGSVLHHRLDRWIAADGRRQEGEADRIVGLFPHAVGVTDPDVQRALDETRSAHRATGPRPCRHRRRTPTPLGRTAWRATGELPRARPLDARGREDRRLPRPLEHARPQHPRTDHDIDRTHRIPTHRTASRDTCPDDPRRR